METVWLMPGWTFLLSAKQHSNLKPTQCIHLTHSTHGLLCSHNKHNLPRTAALTQGVPIFVLAQQKHSTPGASPRNGLRNTDLTLHSSYSPNQPNTLYFSHQEALHKPNTHWRVKHPVTDLRHLRNPTPVTSESMVSHAWNMTVKHAWYNSKLTDS